MYSNAQYPHQDFPGSVYSNKIYLSGGGNPEMFDPIQNVWTNWSKPSTSRWYGCLLNWRDSLIHLGGSRGSNDSTRSLEIYNISTSAWNTIDSSAPFDIYLSGCVLLPSEEILVVGSGFSSNKSAAIYNLEDDEWSNVDDSNFDRWATALVVLGKRIFAVGGGDSESIEEFIYESKSWKTIDKPIMIRRNVHSMISVPAKLFTHMPGGCEGVL